MQTKITEIIFTSFSIKKICLLSSTNTNDLANHKKINTMKHNFNWSFPIGITASVPILTIYLLFLTRQTSKTWKPSRSNTLSETEEHRTEMYLHFFKMSWILHNIKRSKLGDFRVVTKEMRSGLFWYVTQGIVIIPYQLFRTAYWFHLQGARVLPRWDQ